MTTYTVKGKEPNPWGRISEIAARVGVTPGSKGPTIIAHGDDGQPYDVWEVVSAVLDRIDRATPERKS